MKVLIKLDDCNSNGKSYGVAIIDMDSMGNCLERVYAASEKSALHNAKLICEQNGWEIIEGAVRCNDCGWKGVEDELDNEHCPNCDRDDCIMDWPWENEIPGPGSNPNVVVLTIGFEDIDVVSEDGEVMVTLEWIEEGNNGCYQSDDPDDKPLLRYTIYRKYHEGMDHDKLSGFCDPDAYEDGEWMQVNDGSYCTQLSAREERTLLEETAKGILKAVESDVRNLSRNKRQWEEISWISIVDIFKNNGTIINQYPCDESQKVANAGEETVFEVNDWRINQIIWNDRAKEHSPGQIEWSDPYKKE